MTGANNNLNVLERSPLVDDLANGVALLSPQSALHKETTKKGLLSNKKRSAKMLNAHLVYYSNGFEFWLCHLWKADAMNDVMSTCILLHNTIVEDKLPCDDLNNAYLLDDG
ncbi:LOW QUALITY PROTEIN: hypothetical protein PHMEG_00016001 [Phytophthora megakarya]|uniref:Uncharacterized protein n=1 Tax=Phytophthora megakarya TaxID=4795 RepID=A0A225W018_9STRA|nr:LOW QUALITY PROTEIN: hypothetical protein PHMEG_00016001 [Phytophthora megakarya]